ncbi:MAG: N-acetyltransferase, partial [Enterococcus faecalis]|nr:N-acetyltransferase [Enterococcus faecalis]MDU2105243.1 N-acetyltransferase [Enterococcus faecalis]
MKIRQERPAEYQAVERLTYQAFKELNLTENWRPTEHFIVHLLRESADFIPELSLVSETDQGKLTGHIMSSKAKLQLPDHTEKAVLTIGPLSVHPEAQNTGVGSALIKHSVQKAKELGIGGLIILGHPTYYTKFGFVSATTFQITLPEKETSEALLALELLPGYFGTSGGEWHFSTCFAYPETHL